MHRPLLPQQQYRFQARSWFRYLLPQVPFRLLSGRFSSTCFFHGSSKKSQKPASPSRRCQVPKRSTDLLQPTPMLAMKSQSQPYRRPRFQMLPSQNPKIACLGFLLPLPFRRCLFPALFPLPVLSSRPFQQLR